jgi:hypothetical protein
MTHSWSCQLKGLASQQKDSSACIVHRHWVLRSSIGAMHSSHAPLPAYCPGLLTVKGLVVNNLHHLQSFVRRLLIAVRILDVGHASTVCVGCMQALIQEERERRQRAVELIDMPSNLSHR